MGAPSTPILDNFNRSPEDPLLGGGNWGGNIWGNQAGNILNNNYVYSADSTYGSSWWTTQLDADQEAYLTIKADVPTANAIYLRLVNPGGASASCYGLYIYATYVRMLKVDSGETWISDATSYTAAVGTKYCFQAIGTTLTAWADDGGGWDKILEITDASLNRAGYTGFMVYGGYNAIDDFGGGEISALNSYTLDVDAGSFSLAGQDASLLAARLITAEQGAITLSGQAVTLTYSGPPTAFTLSADYARFSLAGQDVALSYSGTTVPDERTFAIDAEDRRYSIANEDRKYAVEG